VKNIHVTVALRKDTGVMKIRRLKRFSGSKNVMDNKFGSKGTVPRKSRLDEAMG
jgi:hypothetical protein